MNIIMSRAVPHHYSHRSPPTPQPPSSSKATTPTSPLDFTERIPFNELRLSSQTLGSGSFGTVFKGSWRKNVVAIKQFRTREEIDSFLVEVKQLSRVKHANIVRLYGASTSADTAYLVMEYAPGGSLNHLLHECKTNYDLRHACSWAMQTARGVAYLHSFRPKPIMHRDLKPANLLLFSNGKTLKICDFGTACAVKTQMTNNTGSASYMAPEVFATSSYLESGDVFSWSIIFWEILVRKQPYSDRYSNPYQILWRVNQGTRPYEIDECPKPIWDLITRSWNRDPRKRPSMQSVYEEMEVIFHVANRSRGGSSSSAVTPTGSSSMDMVSSTNITSPQQQHQQQNLMKRSWLPFFTSQPSNHIVNQTQMSDPRGACIALHRLEMFKERAKDLQNRLQCDKRNSQAESFNEFEELKFIRKDLKQRIRCLESLN